LALTLPRTEEALVRDCVKFRVRGLVYVAMSRDESLMGFGFPKEERAALVASDPDRFLMPVRSDERYNWVRVRLGTLGVDEMREFVLDAWRSRRGLPPRIWTPDSRCRPRGSHVHPGVGQPHHVAAAGRGQ